MYLSAALLIAMKKIKTVCLLFLCAMIWGFSFVAQTKGADSGIGALSYNGFRFIIGTVSLIPVAFIFGKGGNKASSENNNGSKRQLIFGGIIAGCALCCASFTQQMGIHFGIADGTPNITGVAGFITGIYIIFIPIIRLLLGKKTTATTALGALAAVVGLYFLCVTDGIGSIKRAHIVLLLCAVLFACHIIIVDRFAPSVNAVMFSLVQFATAAALGTALALIFEHPTLLQIKAAIVPLLYSGILSSGVAYTLQTIAQKDADPTFAGIVFSTESVFSAVGGAIFLHEIMTGRGYFGCILIFGGIIISQLDLDKIKKANKKGGN